MSAKLITQSNSAPNVRAKAQLANAPATLASKVESIVFGQRLPVTFQLVKLLAARSEVASLKLNVPETFWADEGEMCFLYTDEAGFVRADKSQGYFPLSARESFLAHSSIKNRETRFKNPFGVKFPKFLSFQTENVETLFKRKSALKESLQHSSVLVQRYVAPEGYQAAVKLVHWKLKKPTVTYTLTSRQSLKTLRRDTATADTTAHEVVGNPFIVSLRSLRAASISKLRGMTEDIEEIVDILRREVITREVKGRVAEMMCCLVKGIDGKWYVMGVTRARVEEADHYDEVQSPLSPASARQCIHLADILADEHKLDSLVCRPLPFLSLADFRHTNAQLYRPAADIPHFEHNSVTERTDDAGLDQIAAKLDRLKREGKQLKSQFGVVRKMDYSKYPRDFLDNVIRRLYETVMRDSRLCKFYPSDVKIARDKLEYSVRQTIERGTSRYLKFRMQKIHAHMGITDKDFDQYLRYFAEAMEEEQASRADIIDTVGFLGEFRVDVVMRSRDEAEEEAEEAKSFSEV